MAATADRRELDSAVRLWPILHDGVAPESAEELDLRNLESELYRGAAGDADDDADDAAEARLEAELLHLESQLHKPVDASLPADQAESRVRRSPSPVLAVASKVVVARVSPGRSRPDPSVAASPLRVNEKLERLFRAAAHWGVARDDSATEHEVSSDDEEDETEDETEDKSEDDRGASADQPRQQLTKLQRRLRKAEEARRAERAAAAEATSTLQSKVSELEVQLKRERRKRVSIAAAMQALVGAAQDAERAASGLRAKVSAHPHTMHGARRRSREHRVRVEHTVTVIRACQCQLAPAS